MAGVGRLIDLVGLRDEQFHHLLRGTRQRTAAVGKQADAALYATACNRSANRAQCLHLSLAQGWYYGHAESGSNHRSDGGELIGLKNLCRLVRAGDNRLVDPAPSAGAAIERD